jgi:hypothetical protein
MQGMQTISFFFGIPRMNEVPNTARAKEQIRAIVKHV